MATFVILASVVWFASRAWYEIVYPTGRQPGSSIVGGIVALGVIYLAAEASGQRRVQVLMGFAAIGAVVAQTIGKVGCFLAGCCYGSTTELPWSIPSQLTLSPMPSGIRLHPVQLYEVAGLVGLGCIMVRSLRSDPLKTEQLAGLYLAGYAIIRFIAEIFRGESMQTAWGLTIAQLTMLGVCILLLARIFVRASHRGELVVSK